MPNDKVECIPDEYWQVGVQELEHVEQDKVLVAQAQLLVGAQIRQENTAQVGVQVLRPVVYILHGNTIFSTFSHP